MENGFLTRNQGLDMVEKITGFVKSRTYDRNAIDGLLNDKQDVLTFDNTPTENSTNPVTSGGVYTAISNPDLYEVNIFYDFTLDRFRIPTEYTQSGYAVYKNGEDITNTITDFKTFVDNLNNTNNVLKFYSVKSASVDTPTNHRELLRNYISSNNVTTRFNVYNSDVVGTISFRADEIACTFKESTIDVVDRIVEDTYGCNVRIVLDVTDVPVTDIDLNDLMFANVEDYVQTIKYTKYKVNNTSYTYDTEVTYTDSIIKFINNVLPSLNAHYNLSITVDIIKSIGESSWEEKACYAEYINHGINDIAYYDNYLKLFHDFRTSTAGDIYDYPQNSMQYVGLIVVPSVEHPEATSYCKFARVVDTVPTDESENPVTSNGIYNDIHINIAEDSTYESVKTLSNCGEFPMLSLTAEINAVQDLHGYDAPWAGGAGKNKLDLANASLEKPSWYAAGWNDASLNSENGLTLPRTYINSACGGFTIPAISGDFTLSFRADASEIYECGIWYTTDGTDITEIKASSAPMTALTGNRYYISYTIPSTAQSVVFRPTRYSGTPPYDIYDIMIESGSTPSDTFAPYSNICPISGWSEANVGVSGKNRFDLDAVTSFIKNGVVSTQGLTNQDGVITNSKSYGGDGMFAYYYPMTFSSNTIMVSADIKLSGNYSSNNVFIQMYDSSGSNKIADGEVTMSSKDTWEHKTITLQLSLLTNVNLTIEARGTNNSVQIKNVQLEEGSTATTYEPYNGHTYTIQFTDGSNPLTVYGGSLDVTSGVLTVTDGYIASYNGETLPSTWISDRDVYAEGTTPTTGAEVCYELATPQTYQLTPTQVNSLLGTNNVWADCGDVGDVRYIVKNAASDIITAIKDICYTKTEIDSMIGDISNALDTINGEVV